ncbi:hypothetical protein Nepgr_008026 [Nepenthes gracilis]|uniref:Uncharacterized protein n=1 Tax=Nepenthes gracilis TaxID=150966 RepID=A0AAD3S8U9_NEPGR|nr:hypothetical protein Nepgr_008026 [Nepenthes gracilis]
MIPAGVSPAADVPETGIRGKFEEPGYLKALNHEIKTNLGSVRNEGMLLWLCNKRSCGLILQLHNANCDEAGFVSSFLVCSGHSGGGAGTAIVGFMSLLRWADVAMIAVGVWIQFFGGVLYLANSCC